MKISDFRYTKIPYFVEMLSREGMQVDPKKLFMLTEMLLLTERNYNHFRYNELAREVLTINHGCTWPITKAYIIEMQMVMEQHRCRSINKSTSSEGLNVVPKE